MAIARTIARLSWLGLALGLWLTGAPTLYAKGCSHPSNVTCAACAPAATRENPSPVRARTILAQMNCALPPVMVDVLPRVCYMREHIKGAINIPAARMEELAPQVLPDRRSEIIVYSGGRPDAASRRAADTLARMGYTNVRYYAGGVREWKGIGLGMDANPPTE